jgi:hypothetical protein
MMREGGGQGQGWAYLITVIEVFKRASASLEAPSSPILFPLKLTGKDDERRRRRTRQGWAYLIHVIEVLVKRAFASLEAPSGPIFWLLKLIEKRKM